ncbi:hypothetical protein [Mesorhizobium sp. WSM3224]|uniref:hypothetical protein n=1 Tax=Mesorhizobium sp. WSM3224 TaxID=1040986 RepID=UPI000409B016
MIRLDPATASPAAPPTVPTWALVGGAALNDADAAFRAGAVFGAWRQLAVQPPAASADRLQKSSTS